MMKKEILRIRYIMLLMMINIVIVKSQDTAVFSLRQIIYKEQLKVACIKNDSAHTIRFEDELKNNLLVRLIWRSCDSYDSMLEDDKIYSNVRLKSIQSFNLVDVIELKDTLHYNFIYVKKRLVKTLFLKKADNAGNISESKKIRLSKSFSFDAFGKNIENDKKPKLIMITKCVKKNGTWVCKVTLFKT